VHNILIFCPSYAFYQDYFEKIGVSPIPLGIYVSGDLDPSSDDE
jgi:hypothetical protein